MGTVTNAEWVERFNKYLKRKYPDRSTATHYVSDLKIFMNFCEGDLLAVTSQVVDAFIDEQQKQGYAPATIKRRASSLKIFYDFIEEVQAEERENPVNLRRHGGRVPERLPRDLSDREVEQLLAVIPVGRDLALVVLMLYGGLRVEEVVNLTPAALTIPLDPTEPVRLRVLGKGRKERMVYLQRTVYESVALYLSPPTGEAPKQALFRNQQGKPLSIAGVQWLLRQYAQTSGVEVTCHRLRHTCARWLAEGEMPLLSLARFLGHSSMASTQRYIAGANPQIKRHYQAAMARTNQAETHATPLAEIDFTPSSAPVVVLRTPPTAFTPPSWLSQTPAWWQAGCLAWVNHAWFRWKPSRRQTNALIAMRHLRRFWQWQLTACALTAWETLTQEHIGSFIEAELARQIAPKTIKTTLDKLYAVLHALVTSGQLAQVPTRPTICLPDALPKHLQPAELLRLEDHVQQLTHEEQPPWLTIALYYVLAHAGLRIGELLALRVQDLALQDRRLVIREGKGRKDRMVYLTDTAAHALAAYLWTVPHARADLVFSLQQRPLSYHQALGRLRKLGRAVDIHDLFPLRLRHTYATTLLNNGMTIDALRQLMGHNHLNTTLIYARLADSTVELQYQRAMHQLNLFSAQQLPVT